MGIFLLFLFCQIGFGGKWESVRIKDMPHVMQRRDFCGEACVEMVLRKQGHNGDQNWIFGLSGVQANEARGCYTRGLHKALKAAGFDPGRVWYRIKAAQASAEMENVWNALHSDLMKAIPSIVCMRTRKSKAATEHMRLIVGYEADRDRVIYHEPAEKNGGYRMIKRSAFLDLWPLKYDSNVWTVIRFRMKPGTLKKYRASDGFTEADYAQHLMRLKPGIPKGFSVVLEKPFVVIGNQPREIIERRWARGTVRWAVKHLKALYFSNDPDDILDIWLFKDRKSYQSYNLKLWGVSPDTPFGYYSPTNKVVVMNIATGGGTLVHEIVHPFMRSNFRKCPDWFNEGMGSLYEQSGQRNGTIVGLTNWRLAGLQKAVQQKKLPSFRYLITEPDFYGQTYGYSQARYLCYYLQQKGLLRTFYQTFRKNVKKDPTGYKTLRAILKQKDLSVFQKKWEKWVMTLTFPPSI